MLQQATAETKIAESLTLKNGDYFVTTEDDVLDVGQNMYARDKKWVRGLLLNKQDNDISVLL